MNALESLLTNQETILLDGAMGTMLFSLGLEQGNSPEEWNVTPPDKIRAVHRDYIQAGASIILTNSFGGTCFRLQLHNLQDRVAELNKTAAELARSEADAVAHTILVAGSRALLRPARRATSFRPITWRASPQAVPNVTRRRVGSRPNSITPSSR